MFKGIPFNPTIPFPKMYFKETRLHERFSCNNEALFITVENWKQHKCLIGDCCVTCETHKMKHWAAVKTLLENVIIVMENTVFRTAGYKKYLHLVTPLFYKIYTCTWNKCGRRCTLSCQQQLSLGNTLILFLFTCVF